MEPPVLEIVRTALARAPSFETADQERVLELALELLETDWFRAAGQLDVDRVLDAFGRALEAARWTPEEFRGELENHRRPVPAWEILWSRLWPERGDPYFVALDRRAYGGVHTLVARKVTEAILGQGLLEGSALRGMLEGAIGSVVRGRLLLRFKGVQATTRAPALAAIDDLLALASCGHGVLYALGGTEAQRIEVRLPIWTPESRPRRIAGRRQHAGLPVTVAVIERGAFVPEIVWATPERLTPEIAIREPNVEVRRVMYEILGNERLLAPGVAEFVAEEREYALFRVRVGRSFDFNLLRCRCPSTGRQHVLRVPPEIVDPLAAVAWTFGETRATYRPCIET